MIEVAQHNRFDGYFINQETEGGNAQLATDLRDFMRYMKSRSNLDIVWYDSMVESGPIWWQNELNSQNDAFLQEPGKGLTSDEMFLNFDWDEGNRLTNSANRAASLGRSLYDVFAGIDVEGGGWNQARSNLSTLFRHRRGQRRRRRRSRRLERSLRLRPFPRQRERRPKPRADFCLAGNQRCSYISRMSPPAAIRAASLAGGEDVKPRGLRQRGCPTRRYFPSRRQE
jgi:hypothetical protein